jgi:hypothetical protein
MIAIVNVAIAIAFIGLTVVLPFRYAKLAATFAERVQKKLLRGADRAVFHDSAARDRQLLGRSRLIGGVAAGLFTIIALRWGGLFRDQLGSTWGLLAGAAGSLLLSALGVLLAIAAASFVPKARGYSLLERFGFRAFWVIDARQPSRAVRSALAERIQGATRLGIVDVTGAEILGKGPGQSGGLLYDVLDAFPKVPVQILLLKPDARVLDPEEVLATVFQSLLAEMQVTSGTYMKRINATLNAIQSLNEARPPEGKIDVRFYSEKPMVRAIVLDEIAFISPWQPRDNADETPILEVAREGSEAGFHEAFRRHFARLWATGISMGPSKLEEKPHLKIQRVVAKEAAVAAATARA